jgi:hypothetical protein
MLPERSQGINDLAEFKAVIAEVNDIDATFQAFRCPAVPERPETVRSAVLEFVRRLNALVDLLAQTADALAAEWDLRSEKFGPDGGSMKTTIH